MRMRIPKVNYMFKQNGNVHQIYIYDEVKQEGTFDWNTWEEKESETSAMYFRKQLEQIPETDEIELYINSNGGSVKEGTAIYSQLKRHGAKKTGYVDGVAHSIAFVILQACDHRVMGEGTSALVHEMWVCTAGNARQLREEADKLDILMQSSRKLFMARAKNITEEELKDMMEKETVLTPDMALQYGFIDEIAGREEAAEEPLEAIEDIKQMKEKIRNSEFEKTLEEFRILSEGETPTEPAETHMMDVFFNLFS